MYLKQITPFHRSTFSKKLVILFFLTSLFSACNSTNDTQPAPEKMTTAPALLSQTITNDLTQKYQAKNLTVRIKPTYTFELEQTLTNKNIVSKARLYDITKKDDKTSILYFEPSFNLGSIGTSSLYFQLQYENEKIPPLLANRNQVFAFAANVSAVYQMKLDITGETDSNGEVTINSHPLKGHLIKGNCLELIPTKSDMEELTEGRQSALE